MRTSKALNSFSGISKGRLPGQRRISGEADLSTQQTGAQAPSRLPRPSSHHRRQEGPRRTPCPWSQASERLNLKPSKAFLAGDSIMERRSQRAAFLAAAAGARVAPPAFPLQSRRRDDLGPVRVGFTVSKK